MSRGWKRAGPGRSRTVDQEAYRPQAPENPSRALGRLPFSASDLESGHAHCPESTWSKQPTAMFHLPQRARGWEITGAVEDGGSPCLGGLSGASVSGASLCRRKASGHCCRLASFARKPGRKRNGAKSAPSPPWLMAPSDRRDRQGLVRGAGACRMCPRQRPRGGNIAHLSGACQSCQDWW